MSERDKELIFSLGAMRACYPHNYIKCSICDRFMCQYCKLFRQYERIYICRACANRSIFLQWMDGHIDIDFSKKRI